MSEKKGARRGATQRMNYFGSKCQRLDEEITAIETTIREAKKEDEIEYLTVQDALTK